VASPNRAGAEVFFGGEGNDVLSGGKLQDFLFGGAGNDTIFAGAYTSWAFGGAGDDWLVSGPEGIAASIPYLMGGSGNDIVDARNTFKAHLDGGANDDLLIGSDSHDDFNGGSGDDIVFGGGGAERYYYGGPGIDTMVYASNYGTDLKVDFDWGRVLRIRFIEGSDAGRTELGGGLETPYQFEFIQFANGVYDIAARSFSPGQVRQGADLSQILATPYPTHPENVSVSVSQKSP
jgi:Ca2+-binding RTX toxin-like protein